jgi:hypothetical protein
VPTARASRNPASTGACQCEAGATVRTSPTDAAAVTAPPKTMSPSLVFASHTRSATCAHRTCSPVPAPGVVTRRSSCSADRRRPPGSSPTGTGPSTGTASGSRFRASSAARSMPTRALDAVTRHRRRRPPPKRAQRRDAKAGPPEPSSPRCQHPYVADSFTLPLPRHACHPARKDTRRHDQRVSVENLSSCDP